MHFLTSCNQCFEWNDSWKVLDKRIFESWETLEFGLCKTRRVLEKNHLNVCMNSHHHHLHIEMSVKIQFTFNS